ncbi:MAG TPA: NTP transferase domain-containing protein [Candidatus Limnocylindrales bacterium]|jgi:CTP:molybdopterin cytidylyltransferase MocA|nr:NTP transferase domain-containing protein [Candidatus Limnocylindrales bacterium]
MTVAAVILAPTPESALADADGSTGVRRIADSAWAGGATPIVVVSFDPDGAVATALAGAPVTLAEPPPVETGTAEQIVRGADVARSEVVETDAVLLWPARMAWVGPETVTSLIETHGTDGEAVLRPGWDGEPGWPALVPVRALDDLRSGGSERMPAEILDDLVAAGRRQRILELGDPGAVLDVGTSRADLPAYVGPADPPAGHVHEWGAQAADATDDGPLEGPALAPYAPAGAGED